MIVFVKSVLLFANAVIVKEIRHSNQHLFNHINRRRSILLMKDNRNTRKKPPIFGKSLTNFTRLNGIKLRPHLNNLMNYIAA